jgi:hypothetical protein
MVGGITGGTYSDDISASATVVLTNSWTRYSIDLGGRTYNSVLGGFGWVMGARDAGAGVTFEVDDIQWVQDNTFATTVAAKAIRVPLSRARARGSVRAKSSRPASASPSVCR